MELTVPIQINLPEDWIEQVIERLRNDPDADWAVVIRCKDCKYKKVYAFPPNYNERDYCEKNERVVDVADFCSRAERREE